MNRQLDTPSNEAPNPNTVTAFIPFADMLNYKPIDVCGGDITTPDEDTFRVWSSRPIEKGEQVFIEYGNKGNTELSLYYGFSLFDNPFTSVKIAFYLDPDLPLYAWKRDKLKSAINLDPYHVDQYVLHNHFL